MARRFGGRKSGNYQVLAFIALFLVCLVTFLQCFVDWLQSMSQGSYEPMWQRVLILSVLVLSLITLAVSWLSNAKNPRSPIP